MEPNHPDLSALDNEGVWLVYPVAGERPGQGGDCYEVKSFGDIELAAHRFCNRHDGYKVAFVKPGQSLLEAVHAMEEADD